MRVQRKEEDTGSAGITNYDKTLNRWETIYGDEEMMVGGEDRNKVIAQAQRDRNGVITDPQLNDLIVMLKIAHDWLCSTQRQHMLGGYNVDGLCEDTSTATESAGQPPEQTGDDVQKHTESENVEPTEKTSSTIITIWLKGTWRFTEPKHRVHAC